MRIRHFVGPLRWWPLCAARAVRVKGPLETDWHRIHVIGHVYFDTRP